MTEATTTEVAVFESFTPLAVLNNPETRSSFYERVKAFVDEHEPDVTTAKGRKEIASLAYKIARSKTAIDDAGKKLNEEQRAQIAAVDASRRSIREELDRLKDEVRRPLDEWEKAEDERVEKAKAELDYIRTMGRVDIDATAETVAARICELEAITIDEAVHQEAAGIACAALSDSLEALRAAKSRLDKEEADRAELEKLRREAAEREERERQAEEQRQKEEAAKRAAMEAEAQRKADAEAEELRLKQAAEQAKQDAERAAQAERELAEKAHAEQLAAEKRRADEAEAAVERARERIAAEQEREQKAREADKEHRGAVMKAAKEAMMAEAGIDEAQAKLLVLAIKAGTIPAVTIQF